MKKSLFVFGMGLLLGTSAFAQNWNYAQSPAYGTYQESVVRPDTRQAQAVSARRQREARTTSAYRIGNPLYHPTAGQSLLTGKASYYYTPREESINQDKVTGWTLDPSFEMGITNKLSAYVGAGYGQFKVKSGLNKGAKGSTYNGEVGLRYLLASADGFDFNVKAGLYYDKERIKRYGTTSRTTGTDIALQLGKKIQNITPYFGVGFTSDFWSKRGSSTGTDTYINPGVYIDLNKFLSLDLNYTSEVHHEAVYRATLDFYTTKNTVFSFGGFIIHPETDKDTYGATISAKFAF